MPVYRLPVSITTPQAGLCVNVWHIRTVGVPQPGANDLQAATDAIHTFYGALGNWYPGGMKITADFAVNVVDNTDAAVTWTNIGTNATATAAPPHLSVVVGWKTSVRGRRARGRTFLGPHLASAIDGDGTVSTLFMSVVNDAAQALVNASIVDNGWAVCIWGLQDPAPKGYVAGGGRLADLPHVARDITGRAVQDKFGVMRSRRP